ncbi:hypothetical protein FDP41_008337 [Naegleria fowleri]|uniref:C2 domain-containing protein n=1 Tax=Naegleria fowleri TaxID=5763 RepID=A0A6A5BGL3_NAEFO|nr:uncharacterized protein FDP41_008337 [Naegleria fowleri]KAF0973130.1 hypothetical protein FDP41_008337 [Naegleria fowleri]
MPNLIVTVVTGNNLEGKNFGRASDPFVTILVGPQSQKTTTKVGTIYPKWHETFAFGFVEPQFDSIYFEVFDYEANYKHKPMGNTFPIGALNETLYYRTPQQFILPLQNAKKGELIVNILALDFGLGAPVIPRVRIPTLMVHVIAGEKMVIQNGNTPDPFIIINVGPQEQRTTYKTSIQYPKWFEKFTFSHVLPESEYIIFNVHDYEVNDQHKSLGATNPIPLSSLINRVPQQFSLPIPNSKSGASLQVELLGLDF